MRMFQSLAWIAVFGVSLSSVMAFSAPDATVPGQKDLGTFTVSIVSLDGKTEEFTAPVFKRFIDAKDGTPESFHATEIQYSPLKKKKCHSRFPVDCTRFFDGNNLPGDFMHPVHREMNPNGSPIIEKGNALTRYWRASSEDEIQSFIGDDGYFALAITCILSKHGSDGSLLTSFMDPDDPREGEQEISMRIGLSKLHRIDFLPDQKGFLFDRYPAKFDDGIHYYSRPLASAARIEPIIARGRQLSQTGTPEIRAKKEHTFDSKHLDNTPEGIARTKALEGFLKDVKEIRCIFRPPQETDDQANQSHDHGKVGKQAAK